MKCGIIAEGRADHAVLTNILKGQLGIDQSDIIYLQPEYFYDETDLNSPTFQKMTKAQFSNWELVKNECVSKEKILSFFDNPIDDERFIVIQIDTAEAYLQNYDVIKPDKKDNSQYVEQLRLSISQKMDIWFDDHTFNIIKAICVEETDAWVLTIYTDNKDDTGLLSDPKYQLDKIVLPKKFKNLKLKEINNLKPYEKYYKLTDAFRKNKELKRCSAKNKSLEYFCSLLENLK